METLHDLIKLILAENPSPGTLFIVLSKIKEDGHIREVIQECNKALKIYPDDIRIRQLLAEAYLDSGQISLAEAEADRITEKVRSIISIFRTQADIYGRQGRNDEAAEALKTYLAHHPDDEEALEQLTGLESKKEVPEETATPGDKEALSDIATPTLAEIYLEQGQVEEAIDTYEKIVARSPDDEQSALRLKEIKDQVNAEQTPGNEASDRGNKARDKMITILDNWRLNIRKQKKVSA
jgi:tetratricopeptide (TPR) repeat protein